MASKEQKSEVSEVLREFVRLGGTRLMIENTLNNTVWNT